MGRRRRRRKRRGGGRSRREALGKARPPRGEGPRRAPLARRARGGGSARLLPRLPPRRLSSWAGGGRRLGALPAAERGEREAAFTSGPPARSEPARLRSAPLRAAPLPQPAPPERRRASPPLPLRRHRACAPRPAPPPAPAPPTGRGRSPASRRAASGGHCACAGAAEGAPPLPRGRKHAQTARRGAEERGRRPSLPGRSVARARSRPRLLPRSAGGGAASCAAAAARSSGSWRGGRGPAAEGAVRTRAARGAGPPWGEAPRDRASAGAAGGAP